MADILQATFSILFTCMGRRVLRLYLNYFSLMAHWRPTGHRPLSETGWCNLLMHKCENWPGLIKESVNNIHVKPMFSKSHLGKLKTSCWYIIRRIFYHCKSLQGYVLSAYGLIDETENEKTASPFTSWGNYFSIDQVIVQCWGQFVTQNRF